MPLEELTQFDKYFGQKVDYAFLGQHSLLKLSAQEEENLKEGATLYMEKGRRQIVLDSEIDSGEEGTIYSIVGEPFLVAKIYKRDYRTKNRAEKLKLMVRFENKNIHICWPSDIIKTGAGVFVGFVMPLVKGKRLESLTICRKSMASKYPEVDRKVQVEIILEFLRLFQYLHERNILFGDINLRNIMFDSQYHITFVDMDCVQVDQFPCITTTAGYDSPEVIIARGNDRFDRIPPGKRYKFMLYYEDRYRNLDMEEFAVSVLIYKFLMHNVSPYDYIDFGKNGQDGEFNDNELCMQQKFPYSTESKNVEESAIYKNRWSHFPSFIKEAFVKTFKDGKRYTDEEWIKLFARYKHLLESGKLQKTDPDCMDPCPEYIVNYDAVKFMATDMVEKTGFAMRQTVGQILKILDKNGYIKKQLFKISDILKSKTEVFVYVSNVGKVYIDKLPEDEACIVETYHFQLVYNIGVLKKVKCEYVL